ncbi:MAG: GGDEF domain-containing protein, partial [Betaproteobacteria bacterium]
MKTDPSTSLPAPAKPAQALTEALGQSERVQEIVEECATELTSVNVVLKHGLADQHPQTKIEKALEKSEVIEDKVQEASEVLVEVNQTLEREVHERRVLEFQFAAATEQKDAARQASLHDPLTGLPNRALFNDRLEHGLAQAQRHGWNLAVMFIDLDNFKDINDTHGHDVGDTVLKIIAGRLKENTRGDDTISRFGGDEFLYLLSETRGEQDVASIAAKLIEVIQEACEVGAGGVTLRPCIHASIGIAMFPRDGTTAEVLIKRA